MISKNNYNSSQLYNLDVKSTDKFPIKIQLVSERGKTNFINISLKQYRGIARILQS